MRHKLDASYVVSTARRLRLRIEERFPEAMLNRTAQAVVDLAEKAVSRTAASAKPNVPLRVAIGVLVAVIPLSVAAELWHLDLTLRIKSVSELVSLFTTGIESLVFIGIGILFLGSIEVRLKRKRALDALHELNELAHLVDMHQLDKDPAYLLERDGARTKSSPERTLTAFELNRYLDYCSESLSLIGKIAALYAQTFADPVALDGADRLESLTTGLSRKIWQKVMILERVDVRS